MERFKFVNWVDGMKISRHHFVAEYKAVQELFRRQTSTLVDRDSYGLLPDNHAGSSSIVSSCRIEAASTIHFSLQQLIAVSQSGDFFTYLIGERKPLEKSFTVKLTSDDSEKSLYVAATSDPFNPEQVGEPNPEESPLRYPFIAPSIELHLVTKEELSVQSKQGFLPLARISHRSGELTVDEKYIPPVTSLDSHSDLVGFFHQYIKFMQDIEQNVLRMIFRMNEKTNLSPLAENVKELGKAMVGFTEREIDNLQYFSSKNSPIHLVACTSRLARSIKLHLELLKGAGKEEMLAYFAEWTGLKPGDYEEVLQDTIGMRYDHVDIDRILTQVLSFCKINGKLFKDLSDLDYIGKRKDSNVFVAEKTDFKSTPETKSGRKWEF